MGKAEIFPWAEMACQEAFFKGTEHTRHSGEASVSLPCSCWVVSWQRQAVLGCIVRTGLGTLLEPRESLVRANSLESGGATAQQTANLETRSIVAEQKRFYLLCEA